MEQKIINDNKFFYYLKIMNERKRLKKEELKDKMINGDFDDNDLDALMNMGIDFHEVMSVHQGYQIHQKVESRKIVKQIIDTCYNDIIRIYTENSSFVVSKFKDNERETELRNSFMKEVFNFLNANHSLIDMYRSLIKIFKPNVYDTEIKKCVLINLCKGLRNAFYHAYIKIPEQQYEYDFRGKNNFLFLIKIDDKLREEINSPLLKDKTKINVVDLIRQTYLEICALYNWYDKEFEKNTPKAYKDYISIINKKKAHDINIFNSLLIAQFKSKKDLLKYACLYMPKEKVKEFIKIKDKKIQADTIISIIDKNKTFDNTFINKIYTLFGVS